MTNYYPLEEYFGNDLLLIMQKKKNFIANKDKSKVISVSDRIKIDSPAAFLELVKSNYKRMYVKELIFDQPNGETLVLRSICMDSI